MSITSDIVAVLMIGSLAVPAAFIAALSLERAVNWLRPGALQIFTSPLRTGNYGSRTDDSHIRCMICSVVPPRSTFPFQTYRTYCDDCHGQITPNKT
jgi:hypothetical protein